MMQQVIGSEAKIRLRPSFFPFTEPSFEMDVWFQNKWLELMGCGMVNPIVLKNCGINPDKYSGFAFGVGIDRLVMLKYNIKDIRYFLSGNLEFLEQF
jgi:phenylalanyl-tRNA synthetase alpha chain